VYFSFYIKHEKYFIMFLKSGLNIILTAIFDMRRQIGCEKTKNVVKYLFV